MAWLSKHRSVILYGAALAVLSFLLKWLELKFVLRDHAFEIYTGGIALIFTVLGIWLALQLVKPKVETHIVEKEVYIEIEAGPVTEIRQEEIEKLGISRRELDVLNLMAGGLSNEEIAGKLFVSLSTVKTHSSNIFMKLDVKRRTQAVEKAKRLNIIH